MPRPSKEKPDLRQVLITLLTDTHHASVQELADLLERKKLSYNKTSLYRALEKLVKDGLVCKQLLNDVEAVYELREHHHAHLICENCGAVSSAPCLYQHPSEVKGFSISHHHVTLLGLCQACAVA